MPLALIGEDTDAGMLKVSMRCSSMLWIAFETAAEKDSTLGLKEGKDQGAKFVVSKKGKEIMGQSVCSLDQE